jgi:hypothetical protein
MWSFTLADVLDRGHQRLTARRRVLRSHVVGLTGLTVVVLAVGLAIAQAKPERAGDEPSAVAQPKRFVAESRATLKVLQEELAGLGVQVLEGLDMGEPAPGDVASQSLAVESAKAEQQKAILVRQAAEIALKEYQDGSFKQEKKTCETEVELAQAELESAKGAVQPARERYAKIKQASTGSVGDLVAEWQFENAEISAQFQEKKAKFTLETAQSKLKVLLEYENPKRVKELMSNVEKARSSELAKRATWQLEQAKLQKMQNPAKSQGRLTAERKRILALLDRAIPIEEKLSDRLDQIKPDIQPGDANRQEINDLTRQLKEIVDAALAEDAAAALAGLKARLDRAAGQ